MVHVVCDKCGYERRYVDRDYDYCFSNGERLYVIKGLAWCHSCKQVAFVEFVPSVEHSEGERRRFRLKSRSIGPPCLSTVVRRHHTIAMNTSNHPPVATRISFRVLAGCISFLMFATAPVWIYFAITEGPWFAWLFGLVTLFA